MIESPLLKELMDECKEIATQQGLQEGMQQGLQQGMQQGMQQGIQQGMQQGIQRGMKRTIIRQLKKRFVEIPDDIAAALEKNLSYDELDSLTDWALSCPSLESFRQKLSK